MKTKNIATFFAIMAAALYAINIPLSKLLLTQVSPTMMAAFLYLGAGFGLYLYGLITKEKKHSEPLTKAELPYTVGMILRQIEGNLSTVSCLEDDQNKCMRCNNCVTLEVWQQINDAVNNVIDNITLQDLLVKQLAQSNAVQNTEV